MIGIGVSIAVLFFYSKQWVYSALLGVIVILSFIIFRLVGSYLLGSLSGTQLSFLAIEILEAGIGIVLLKKKGRVSL